MPLEEIHKAVEESYRKLLANSCPPVHYYLLTDIGGLTEDDSKVRRTLAECSRYPPRVRLLEKLRPDGTWPIPSSRRHAEEKGRGPPYGWTYITMLRNLYDLGEFQACREEGHIVASLERILSWQTDEGWIPGPWDVPFPLPHYNGYALRALLRFGMEDDPRVQRLARWLLKSQRPDGGWSIPYVMDMKYLPEYKRVRIGDFLELVRSGEVHSYSSSDYDHVPSCVWTTMMVVRGLCQSFALAQTEQTRRGADFFVSRFFKKNHHPGFYRSEGHWTRLKYPTYFGSGLCALDLATWLGFGADDKRLLRPIVWLLEARSRDGLWTQSDRPNPTKDQWISEIATSILNRYGQSMRGEPFGLRAQLLKGGRR